jgi:hypothetical protein
MAETFTKQSVSHESAKMVAAAVAKATPRYPRSSRSLMKAVC